MDFVEGGPEALGEHRQVGHRRELQQHRRGLPQKHRKQRKDVRRAIFQQEDLAPGCITPRRVGIDQVRLRQLGLRRHGLAAHFDISSAQALEIPPRRRSQILIPLEVHHPLRHLAQRPTVHAQPTCQVQNRPDRTIAFLKPPPLRGAPYEGGMTDFVGRLRCFNFLSEVSLTLRRDA